LISTVAELEIFAPFSVNWKFAEPAITAAGLIEVNVGTALTTWIVSVLEL